MPCCIYQLNEEEIKDPALKGSVEEAFNSQTFQRIREKMKNREWIDGCYNCYRQEDAGYRSYGRTFSEIRTDLPLYVLKEVDIALSRECNLACQMCDATFSTKWDNVERKLYPDRPAAHKVSLRIRKYKILFQALTLIKPWTYGK